MQFADVVDGEGNEIKYIKWKNVMTACSFVNRGAAPPLSRFKRTREELRVSTEKIQAEEIFIFSSQKVLRSSVQWAAFAVLAPRNGQRLKF